MTKNTITGLLITTTLLIGCDKKSDTAQDYNTPPAIDKSSDTKPVTQQDTSPLNKIRENARNRGIDFRAVGQEPGWLVEIDEDKGMNILADYGDKKFTTPAPTKDLNKETGVLTYRSKTESHTVIITVKRTPCNDAMSGFPFEATVTMTLDSATYNGCGEKP